ncbi:succinylglutamate-semialdehyde dehydrogenase [Pelagicoccus mobilis]|uniref:Succinylglutamate-semialdehyde dehydrogenase n=1 Tax=Pelagicoccus mobilis TaxID=415221 RepID=A0A934RV29_9BACT|nr:succinylglutamate-semialdehyde dehydrogenase [Pelagicoccus mobilis]MBK1875970.1 succinylglutamate-semialdehyde dehydrogenase [Pelagicoccus mobilis]
MIENFISGDWEEGASERSQLSVDPSTGKERTAWQAASSEQVDKAVAAARGTFAEWSNTSLQERESILQRYAEIVSEHEDQIAAAIQSEAGKPLWEARQEAKAVAGKVALSIKAYAQRCASFGSAPSRVSFRPHGVLAVLGPFNFPAHLPNGHIVPALLAGNTIVFKPSERVPLAAQLMGKCWEQAGLPKGVLNIVQGDGETGAALAEHEQIDGLLFTGGSKLGEHFRKRYAEHPDKILALELGGNNPLVVWDSSDVETAIDLILQSAYVTAGQRCTCARRLIIPDNSFGQSVIDQLSAAIDEIRVGSAYASPEVFMGPVISPDTALSLIEKQTEFTDKGANPIRSCRILEENTGLVSPGLIDVTELRDLPDEEIFGPLLQVKRVSTFEEAVSEANNTNYGLAAGLISQDQELYKTFHREVRAGIINWNKPLTGASGAAPFGGIGLSGNHRPSGFFAADYCSYAVASLESSEIEAGALPPGLRPA